MVYEQVERVVSLWLRPLEDHGIGPDRGVVGPEDERDAAAANGEILDRDALRAREQAGGDARAPCSRGQRVVRQHLEAVHLRGERAGAHGGDAVETRAFGHVSGERRDGHGDEREDGQRHRHLDERHAAACRGMTKDERNSTCVRDPHLWAHRT